MCVQLINIPEATHPAVDLLDLPLGVTTMVESDPHQEEITAVEESQGEGDGGTDKAVVAETLPSSFPCPGLGPRPNY